MGLKENIKEKRLEQGLTLEEIAKRIGVTKQTVQKYESGVVTNIPSDKIEKLANIFDVSPAYLMGWTEKQLTSFGISRTTGQVVDHTTPNQLEELSNFFTETKKVPTQDELIDLLKSIPREAYSDIWEQLMYSKFKYYYSRR